MNVNSGGANRSPITVATTTKPIATNDDLEDPDRRDAALGDDSRHDGEDHQAEHVVGDRRAEHGARFDRRERAQVAEHPCGDADARRGQRGADEQRFLTGEAEADPGRDAGRHRYDDADDRDEQRRPTDRAQVAEVHLHADLEQQEDDAELGEGVDDFVRFDEAEQRRPDEDAGGDLGDDGRDVDAVRDLSGDLGRDEHDQDVEQDRVDVHRGAHPRSGSSNVGNGTVGAGRPDPHLGASVAVHSCAPGSACTAARRAGWTGRRPGARGRRPFR